MDQKEILTYYLFFVMFIWAVLMFIRARKYYRPEQVDVLSPEAVTEAFKNGFPFFIEILISLLVLAVLMIIPVIYYTA